MQRTGIAVALLLLLAFSASPVAASGPAPAQEILTAALTRASTDGRNVFVIFHASWCRWCKKLDGVLASPDVREIFQSSYVAVHIDVLERGSKVDSLENPGGKALMSEFGGEKSGLPFYVVLDGKGKKLVNSNLMPGDSNIGFPGAPEELDAFASILKESAPHMSDDQRKAIIGKLEHEGNAK
jgi:thiol:disulfide interchange protein